MILKTDTLAEAVFALDACKGHPTVVTFTNGRFFGGKVEGYAPASGYKRYKVGGYVISPTNVKQVEVRL